jgi:prevent-host-death family protein
MHEVSISEFKAKCLSLIDQVQKTKQPILITRRGRPVAEVVPPSPVRANDWMGSMRGTATILGDIISPVIEPNEWEDGQD